jgi:hypothetical protein
MPDERDVANDKRVLQQNEREGTTSEMEGKHPEHAPVPGQKTPQAHADRDAIDESGNLINPKEKDENDGM